MSAIRRYYPGNNTPLGFFSYYGDILGQREASRIICIKGGPGTGKSTLMRSLGERFAAEGERVDFLQCSADDSSLDAVVLRDRKAALIDGTSPHVTDPLTPGAVDRIVDLGRFWNREAIEANKEEIIALNEETAKWYRRAYNYLRAAGSVYESLREIYEEAAEHGEIYRLVAGIIEREYTGLEISASCGNKKRFFASAITADGVVNHLKTMLCGMKRVYLINAPAGYAGGSFLDILSEGALYRGLDVECFYCSMEPEQKLEHLLIPQLGTAFITVNVYHDLEPWEICGQEEDEEEKEIVLLDLNDYVNKTRLSENQELITSLGEEYDVLLGRAVSGLAKAKENHMKVEGLYVPTMNFARVAALAEELAGELEALPQQD